MGIFSTGTEKEDFLGFFGLDSDLGKRKGA